jgi:hypothetical protein
MRLVKLIVVVCGLVAIGLAVRSCWFTPAARAELAVEQAIQALEHGDSAAVLAFVEDDFFDSAGIDAVAFTKLLERKWRGWKDIDIRLLHTKAEMADGEATLRADVVVEATAADTIGLGKTPDRQVGHRDNLELRLRETNGRWRLRGLGGISPADWQD